MKLNLAHFKPMLMISSFVLLIAVMQPVYADIGKAVSLGVNSGCVSTVNGSAGNVSQTETYGSTINLPVNNGDGVVSQTVSGPGVPTGTTLEPNTKSSTHSSQTFSIGPITSPITITFTPIPSNDPGTVYTNNCPTGSTPVASTVTFSPAAPPASSPTSTPAAPAKKTTTSSPTAAPTTTTPDTTPDTTKQDPTSTEKPMIHLEDNDDSNLPTTSHYLLLKLLVALGVCGLGLLSWLAVKKGWLKRFKSSKRHTKK